MGIAHGRPDILVAEQFLDFPQILSHLVEEDRGRGVAQPMRGDLPYPNTRKRNLRSWRSAAAAVTRSKSESSPMALPF
jgi:hypothetical protein